MNQSPVLEAPVSLPSTVSKAQLRSNFLSAHRSRAVHVAYAFARVVPYAVVEDPTYTRVPSKGWREFFVRTVVDELLRLRGEPAAHHVRPSDMPGYRARHKTLREEVTAWMSVPLSPERIACRDAARSAWFARKAASATRFRVSRSEKAVSA